MSSLRKLEKLIDKNIKAAWYQNGLILTKIRDEGLYKKQYGTFENYIVERWDFDKSRIYQLINSADLTQKIAQFQSKNEDKSLLKVDFLPQSETHLRPLSSLKNDSEKVTVWQNVVEHSKNKGVKITAEFVKTKVDEFVASGEIVECLDFEVIDTKINIGVTATLNTGDEEWYTPAKYLESARLVMGGIDLDPASNTWAQENVKAETYYTIHDDGLTKNWSGKVWLNPPYTARVINAFLEKITAHYQAGEITDAIVLTNNSADTSWFHKSAVVASALCFTAGRINFLKPSGETSSPTNGQLFFYFGNDVAAFKNEFSQYGLVVVKA